MIASGSSVAWSAPSCRDAPVAPSTTTVAGAPVGVSMRHRSYDRRLGPPGSTAADGAGLAARRDRADADGVGAGEVGHGGRGAGSRPSDAGRAHAARRDHDAALVQHGEAPDARCARCGSPCPRGSRPSSARRRSRAVAARARRPRARAPPRGRPRRAPAAGAAATRAARRRRRRGGRRRVAGGRRGHAPTGSRARPRRGNGTSVLGPLAGPDAVAHRPHRRLGAVVHADRAEDAGQVRLDGLLADARGAAR